MGRTASEPGLCPDGWRWAPASLTPEKGTRGKIPEKCLNTEGRGPVICHCFPSGCTSFSGEEDAGGHPLLGRRHQSRNLETSRVSVSGERGVSDLRDGVTRELILRVVHGSEVKDASVKMGPPYFFKITFLRDNLVPRDSAAFKYKMQ